MLRKISSRLICLFAVIAIVFLTEGCASAYQNRNWHRTPPSTGRNRCGCYLEMPVKAVPSQPNVSGRA